MIIAHLPAGFICARLLAGRWQIPVHQHRSFLFASLAGAIAPDLDMFYFHLVDHRRHHHHTYFTHFPVVWLSLLIISLIWWRLDRQRSHAMLATVFSLNGMIHMLLDTMAGDIWWFAPWLDQPFALTKVLPVYQPWWLNFLLHWSFAIELLLVSWSIYLWKNTNLSKYA